MFQRFIASFVCITFIFSNFQYVHAQDFRINQLPAPGSMVATSPNFVPLTLKGLVIHPENALKFDFIMDTGNSHLKGSPLREEALKVMKYFLTALTMPEDDMWVNLSPYEKGKVVENNFGGTLMGRDLLAEDYVLKQLTASLIYPENALGKKFWREVYQKAQSQLGTTQIPVNTFNKVWIVPSEAVVWEHEGKVMIVKSHLKVMLEEDYLSLKNHTVAPKDQSHALASQVVREIVLPVLEKQVNEGEYFAQLRQMYQAMVLATWYKKALKESIISKVYANQKKVKGVDSESTSDIEDIYQQYIKAFKKGAFNYIKEDIDPVTGQTTPRKYFSGGFSPLVNGVTSLAVALGIWLGSASQLSAAQQADINQASNHIGNMILVEGNVSEARVTQTNHDAAMLAKIRMNWILNHNMREKLTEKLNDFLVGIKDPYILDDLITTLGNSGRNEAVIPLISLRNHKERFIRMGIVNALGNIGDKSATSTLVEFLRDKDVEINAVIAIGKIRDDQSVPALIGKFWEADNQLKNSIVTALAEIGDERGLPILLNAMKNAYGDNILLIRKALGKIGNMEAVKALLDDLDQAKSEYNRHCTSEGLKQITNKAVIPLLLQYLEKFEKNVPSIYEYNIVSETLARLGNNSGGIYYWVVTEPGNNGMETIVAPYGSDPYVIQSVRTGTPTEAKGYFRKVDRKTGREIKRFDFVAVPHSNEKPRLLSYVLEARNPGSAQYLGGGYESWTVDIYARYEDGVEIFLGVGSDGTNGPQWNGQVPERWSDSQNDSAMLGQSQLSEDQTSKINYLLSVLQYRDNITSADKVDDLVILGNDNLDVFRQTLRLWRQHKDSRIVILGGKGRLTVPLLEEAGKKGFTIKDQSSEAIIIQQIIQQMISNEAEFSDLKNGPLPVFGLEGKSTNTPENLKNYKDELVPKQEKAFNIVCLQTPHQQLRSKATIEKVLGDEIVKGRIAVKSDTASYDLNGKTKAKILEDILGEPVRLIIYSSKGNNTIADVNLSAEFWKDATELYQSLSEEEKGSLTKFLFDLILGAKKPVNELLSQISQEQRDFLDPIVKKAQDARLLGQMPSLATIAAVKKVQNSKPDTAMLSTFEIVGTIAGIIGGISLLKWLLKAIPSNTQDPGETETLNLGPNGEKNGHWEIEEWDGTGNPPVWPDGMPNASYNPTRRWVSDTPNNNEQGNDKAMQALKVDKNSKNLGGISLDSKQLDLQIKRDDNGIPLPISQQPLDKINIQGFVPAIIDIKPIDLPQLLGINLSRENVVLAKT